MFYSGFDALFSILFPLVFLVVLGMILFTVVSNLRTWSKNNASPRLAVPATVVAKRMNVSRHHTDNTMTHGTCSRWFGLRNACRRRHRKAELSGHAVSGV